MKAGVVLITGASSGIGEACAKRFAAAGHRVALVARSAGKLEALAEQLGPNAKAYPGNAADGDTMIGIVQAVTSGWGTPDVVINSAGAGAWKRVEETTPEEAREMMDAPYHAAFNASHAVLPGMLERRSGVLIHIGSPASMAPWPGSAGYAAARWALRGLHESLVADLAGSGVRSCHVVFGRVSSAYFDVNAHAGERVPSIGNLIPTMTPEECADLVFNTAQRPRNEVRRPAMLAAFYAVHAVAPWLTRYLLRTTGHSV